jgi:branched-chain amino acid transport system permease protein
VVLAINKYLPRLAPKPPLPPDKPLSRRAHAGLAGKPVLTIDKATRRFGALAAVDGVSFEVKAHEVLGLIGPNGAGKSTLLNLITGVLKPNSGAILFAGSDITPLPPRRIAAAGMARTFQHVKLRPNMTLLDNALLGSYPRTHAGFVAGALRLDRAEERAARFDALTQLNRVGLGDRYGDLAGNLPLGQQRLLEVGRALAADPTLLVLDEPAAGLRRMEKQTLSDLLRQLRSEGMTIILVEHDMEFVMNLVDRIVVMDFGIKLAEGLPAAIRADARVQEAYLGGVV